MKNMKYQTSLISRRELLHAFTATVATAAMAVPTYSNAATFLRGSGDIRRIKMYSNQSGETLDMIYWIEGKYIKDALAEVDWFMRDLRKNKSYMIDTRTVDIISATQRILETQSPLHLLSGYRTESTNKLLRSRLGGGVAKKSLHLIGQAADISLPGRSVNQIARAAALCAAGGVGKYSKSHFVHIDCGKIRIWGQ